ncbi:radical SAM protein [Kitasatospora sp. NPDC059327]|uniref:radical SAM protein n=1 Tax=Kitasatospora sp. NPDC059327 TaxID=3346803 RepID=UPI0036B72AB6
MDGTTSPQVEIHELYRSLDTEDRTEAVSVILKLRGETCDVDCLYCFEKRKEAPGGATVTADQVRDLGRLFRGRPVAIELHGGEPLTVGRERMAAVLRELAAQPNVVRVSLQTNGVLLDAEWLDLFDELCPGLRIGISLDGDAKGNAWRVGYDGRPIYPRVAAALELLAARGKAAGVVCAVTPAVLGRAGAVLDHLAGFGSVKAVNFVPCFDATVRRPTASTGRRPRVPRSRELQATAVSGDAAPAWAVHPDEYAAFVLAATIRWIEAGYFRRMKMDPAVATIRALRGLDTGHCHFSNLKCDHVFTLYPDGRLGSCDELPWPQARLTHLRDTADQRQLIARQRSSILLGQGKALMGKCGTCDYAGPCGGGCVASRWRMNLAGNGGGDDAYCDYRMRMIDGVAALLADPGHSAGAWCRTLRWRPRATNSMGDVAAFVTRWDDPEAHRPAARLLTSGHGNVNTAGLPGVHEADDLDPRHPQWHEGIEPGAWPLVDTITGRWGLITYDSCQGHPYTGLELAPRPRQVGVLARDRDEYARAGAALCRAVAAALPHLPDPVTVTVGRSELTCETGATTTAALDLELVPAPGHDWAAYFEHLDAATAAVARALEGERPTGADCHCPIPEPAATTEGAAPCPTLT